MVYRNEIKHVITAGDRAAICASLRAVAAPDPHAGPDGSYHIRSLYFDNLQDKALREKLDGVSQREKFRIRYYDGNPGVMHLEKKVKRGDLGCKVSAPLTEEEVRRLLAGDLSWMPVSGRGLVIELYSKMKAQGLRPRTLVEYDRIPFVYGPGNVRVTIDYNLRTALSPERFLDPHCPTLPAADAPILLEVKWDEFLPAPIRRAIQVRGRRAAAFSKYAACRLYG